MKVLSLTVAIITALMAPISAKDSPKLTAWFESAMKGESEALKAPIPAGKGLKEVKAAVFSAYQAAALNQDWDKQFLPPNDLPDKLVKGMKLKTSSYHIAEGLDMPYFAVRRGKRPENGWPLAIAMHGGGSTGDRLASPHDWPINSREWKAQINLSMSAYPSDMIYFVPRMVDDNQGRWWKEFNHTAFTAMIRHAVLYWDVDPNRIYMLGISEGGYGTETLTCRYPTWFAAANGMACGSGTSIHLENLRNLPFRTDVGEHDTMFKRFSNAVSKHALLDKYREADQGGYENHLEVHKGRGHGIDYRPGPKWMVGKVRNPHPKRVTYTLFQHDKVKNNGAYWLEVVNDLDKKVIKLDAVIDSKENSISIQAMASVNDETVQSADAQQALADPGEFVEAKGLKLRLWLDDELLDLSKPITILINGKSANIAKVKPSMEAMCKSLLAFGDPSRVYPAKIEVVIP